jgi:hypothetical protein
MVLNIHQHKYHLMEVVLLQHIHIQSYQHLIPYQYCISIHIICYQLNEFQYMIMIRYNNHHLFYLNHLNLVHISNRLLYIFYYILYYHKLIHNLFQYMKQHIYYFLHYLIYKLVFLQLNIYIHKHD